MAHIDQILAKRHAAEYAIESTVVSATRFQLADVNRVATNRKDIWKGMTGKLITPQSEVSADSLPNFDVGHARLLAHDILHKRFEC